LLGVLRAEDVLEDIFERFEVLAGIGAMAVARAAGRFIFAGHFSGHASFSRRQIHFNSRSAKQKRRIRSSASVKPG
jgi:hypothetical protein